MICNAEVSKIYDKIYPEQSTSSPPSAFYSINLNSNMLKHSEV